MGNITNKQLERMKALMGGVKPVNEGVNLSSITLTKKAPNDKYYGIVKEINKYFIKESIDGVNYDYIGGLGNKNKNQFNSYEEATRRLNLMFEDFNRTYGVEEGTNILTPDLIQEKKFVIKTKKKKKSKGSEEATGFDFGGEEETTDTETEGGEEFDFGGDTEEGEEETTDTDTETEGGEEFDFGGEEETTDTETEITDDETDEDLDLESDSEDNIKDIQKLTGKLGQKLRDTEDVSSDLSKWVAKSVISALDLDLMDSEDKKDIIRAIKKKGKEDSDAEFDFMSNDPEDDEDDYDIWYPDQDFKTRFLSAHDEGDYIEDDDVEFDWSKLSDAEKSRLMTTEDEEIDYGPGGEEVEGSEIILDDYMEDSDDDLVDWNSLSDEEKTMVLNPKEDYMSGCTDYMSGCKDYMDDPYMMPKTAPTKPTTKPDVKPGTDRPSPSKKPFTRPPHIPPDEESAPKALEDEDFYGINYDNDETIDYMEDNPNIIKRSEIDYMNDYVMKEDHLNTKMATIEQEMAYEDVESMARQNGLEISWDKKDKSSDPEEETIYLNLKRGNKIVGSVRINAVGDVEVGGPMKKSFKGQPLDNLNDFYEYLGEKNIEMSPKTAPTKPTTKPDVKPGTDKPTPSKRPFTRPPHIPPDEESAPKAKTEGYIATNKKKISEAVKVTKTQLFKSLDKKNLSNEKLNDLDYLKKLIDNVLDTEFDFVADNTETLAKEYISKNQ
jgi:hypothetical protein